MTTGDPKSTKPSKPATPNAAAAPEPKEDRGGPRKRFARRIDCAGTPLSSPAVTSEPQPVEERKAPKSS